jgi:hypothetical protein
MSEVPLQGLVLDVCTSAAQEMNQPWPAKKHLPRGASPVRKRPPPWDPHRTLGIGLRWGPRGVRFLVSEAPLQSATSSTHGQPKCFRAENNRSVSFFQYSGDFTLHVKIIMLLSNMFVYQTIIS